MMKIFGLIILSGVFMVLSRALVPDNDNIPMISFILFWIVVLLIGYYKKKKLKVEREREKERKRAKGKKEDQEREVEREREREVERERELEAEFERKERERPGCIEKLRKIPGISQRMAEYIMNTYSNSSGIEEATEEELRSLPKVSKNIAAAIKRAFSQKSENIHIKGPKNKLPG